MSTLQITLRDLAHSDALEARIRECAEKLERAHPGLTSCRVVIARHAAQGHDARFEVHLDVRARGHQEALSTRKHGADAQAAVRQAFDAAGAHLGTAARKAG